MHKSGTSLVSEVLHHSGIEMVEQGADGDYDSGFHHERQATAAINKDLLGAWGRHSLDVSRFLTLEAADPQTRANARRLVEELTERGIDWGFKDPRTCLTYPVWRQLLPPHKLLCIHRELGAVCRHYARQKGKSAFKVFDAWHQYNSGMLQAYETAAPEHRLMIGYSELMEGNDGLERIGALLGRPLQDRRNGELRRSGERGGRGLLAKAWLYRLRTGRDLLTLQSELQRRSCGHQPA
jgi:hypothetical protein